jgi:curved DNA-binding protein CbpA
MKSTLYEILHIGDKASLEEVTTAYQSQKSLLMDAGDEDSKNKLTLVQHAFEMLSDQSQRTRYDQRLKALATPDNTAFQTSAASSGAGMSGFTKLLALLVVAAIAYFAYQKFHKVPQVNGAPGNGSPVLQREAPPSPEAPPDNASMPIPRQAETQAAPAETINSPVMPTVPTPAPAPVSTSPAQPVESPPLSAAPVPQQTMQTRSGDVNDINSVPLPNPTTQRRAYYDFLSKRNPRAFVICTDGSVLIFSGEMKFINQKITEMSGRCSPYAIDDAVVWKP